MLLLLQNQVARFSIHRKYIGLYKGTEYLNYQKGFYLLLFVFG